MSGKRGEIRSEGEVDMETSEMIPPPSYDDLAPLRPSAPPPNPTFEITDHDVDRLSLKSSRSSDDDDHSLSAGNDPEAAGEWSEHRQKRETWTGQLDFILSCIGYAVGLGNVWRFPYLCYKNGGAAFLIPYFIFLALCGMPLTMLEMCMGQFTSLGPTALFQKFCPMFQGLGWAQVLISGIVCIYYNMIIAWTLYYLYHSFRLVLPWATCDNWWNSNETCVHGIKDLLFNETTDNDTSNVTIKFETASEQYWKDYVLRISDGIDNVGGMQWQLVLALFLAWIMIFCCLFKGVKSSGRVVYVTATFPYVVMVILCIRGLTLPGAFKGISYYLIPKWHMLLQLDVWISAASQIFYSVGAAWGVMYTFASFNKFHHNCYRDAIIIPLINCATSVFAGIVVFSIIGYMAEESGQEVEKVITSGPGLAFVVYPEAVTSLPFSPLWAVLFFLMLLTIGVDSQFGMFETLITAIVDTWPHLLRHRKPAFTALACTLMFFAGLIFTTNGGMYYLQLMDWYCATFSLMIVGTAECLLVAWNYGYQRFMMDVQLMVRYKGSMWWPICWGFITPVLVSGLLILSIARAVPVTYDKVYVYPDWAVNLGWSIAALSVIPIPFYIVRNMLKAKGTFRERVTECMRPRPDWGPSRLGDRVVYRKSFAQVPSKQLYVQGVERQETEMQDIIAVRPSCADLSKFIEEVHIKGSTLDVNVS